MKHALLSVGCKIDWIMSGHEAVFRQEPACRQKRHDKTWIRHRTGLSEDN